MKKSMRCIIPVTVFLVLFTGTLFAGENFTLSNLSWDNMDGTARVVGEIENLSGRSYTQAVFALSVYSESGKLAERISFVLNDFKNGEKASFEAYGMREIPKKSTFKVRLDVGM